MRVAINDSAYLVTDLREGEYVFVKPGGSDFGEVSGTVSGLYPQGAVAINLHLEDDHPAMQDFIADNEDEDGNPLTGRHSGPGGVLRHRPDQPRRARRRDSDPGLDRVH